MALNATVSGARFDALEASQALPLLSGALLLLRLARS
jgi:hypothetical protein